MSFIREFKFEMKEARVEKFNLKSANSHCFYWENIV